MFTQPYAYGLNQTPMILLKLLYLKPDEHEVVIALSGNRK